MLTAVGLAEQRLGRWESALEHLDQARALDPRSGAAARRYARALLWLRRYPEALAAYDRNLVVDPANVAALEQKVMVHLALGDLGAARRVIKAAPREIDSTTLVAYVATYWDLPWLLDEALRQGERALDLLEPLLRTPFYLSPGWLGVDPSFAPLHGDTRFERMVGRKGVA